MQTSMIRELPESAALMALTLVFDGACPFCRQFALRSELKAGIPDLHIIDGRQENDLRRRLSERGLNLADGAVLLEGEQAWHGSAAIAEISRRMKPSDPLLKLLQAVFHDRQRAAFAYPALLLARRLALLIQGLRPDPDAL